MRHKNRIIWGAIAFVAFVSWLLFFKMIPPGYTGIVVNLFGEAKGASPKELGVGMHWIAPWKRVYRFPMFEQNHIWEEKKSFTFQTGEGLNVNADIGISYHLHPGRVHILFDKFRRGMDEITDLFIRNYARDAINKSASKMKVEDLYGTDKQQFIEEIQEGLRQDLDSIGIVIDRVYLIGTLHFPSQVVAALNSKIEATQRAQQRENELREAKAQAEKDIAQASGKAQARTVEAEAEARANQIISQSVTEGLIYYKLIDQWDGKLPSFVSTGAVSPLLSIPAN